MLRLLPKLFILVTLVIALLPLSNGAAQDDDSVATLIPYQGLIQYLPASAIEGLPADQPIDEALWQIVEQEILVSVGDQIRTGASGWAELVFFEGTSSQILENTQLQVTELDLPDSEGGSFGITLDLLVGDTLNSVSTILDSDSSFEVTMPGVTASVRGTVWYARVMPTGCSMVYTEEGSVATFNGIAFDRDRPRLVEPGDSVIFLLNGRLDRLRPGWEPPQVPEGITLGLAGINCGNGVLDEGEAGVCDLDLVGNLLDCGDGFCDRTAGEGLLSCPYDCSPLRFVSREDFLQRLVYPPGDERNRFYRPG